MSYSIILYLHMYMSINFIKKNVLLFKLYDDMKYWYDMVLKYEMGLSGQNEIFDYNIYIWVLILKKSSFDIP